MHPEILEDKAGTCRSARWISCRSGSIRSGPAARKPLPSSQDTPGRCPIDGTALVQVTAAVSWTCAGGTDGIGVARHLRRRLADDEELRAARARQPQPAARRAVLHGRRQRHHLEGTYLPTGVFRMHFYDDYTKPQTLAAVHEPTRRRSMVKDPKTGKETTYPAGAQRPLPAGGDRQAAAARRRCTRR